MSDSPLAVLILAAGSGTRTRVSVPKVLLPLCGSPLLEYVIDEAARLAADHVVVVLHHAMDEIVARLGPRFEREHCLVVDQGGTLGTGHAVGQGLQALDRELGRPYEGDVVVVYGDSPLITADTLTDLVGVLHLPHDGAHGTNGDPTSGSAAALLTSDEIPSSGLGRILRDESGLFCGIREERDCSDEELAIQEVNTGFYAFQTRALRSVLRGIAPDNEQKEYYLTDALGLLLAAGEHVETIEAPEPDEVLGVNDLAQLTEARWVMQERILFDHMDAGVLIEDPATTVIDRGVVIGEGTRIRPFVVIKSGVKIGAGCDVGPFTQLRAGAVLDDGAEVGNFVEVKKSRVGRGSKAKHLTYLGDTIVGAGANIGAGTITANYDGKAKHETRIEDGAFIGSGTIVVAPATIGQGATTGAGAVVTKDVPAGEVHVGVPAKRLKKKEGGA